MPKPTWSYRFARRFSAMKSPSACSKESSLTRFVVASAAGGSLLTIYYLREKSWVFAQSTASEKKPEAWWSSAPVTKPRFYIPIFDRNRSLSADGKSDDQLNWHHLHLQNVQIFFRHGARTPLHAFDTLPIEEQAVWHGSMLGEPIRTMIKYDLRKLDGRTPISLADSPYDRDLYSKMVFPGGCIAGQMTMLGKMQTFHLGRQLRSHYINQLGLTKRTFSSKEVYVRSTYIKRTVESARCLIAGMFDHEAVGAETPVIHVATNEDEVMFPNGALCQAYKNSTLELFTHFDEIPGLTSVRESIEKLIGYNNTPGSDGKPRKPLNMSDVRDALVAQREHGLPIPQRLEAWLDKVDKLAVEVVLRFVVGVNVNNADAIRRVLRVSVGPALDMIQQNIAHALDTKQPYYKLMLYSTHDSTLVALLYALGIFDHKWPPFAADLCIETYVDEATRETWIRVMYMGNPMKLPGADGDFCSLRQFCKILAPFTVEFNEYIKECDAEDQKPTSRK